MAGILTIGDWLGGPDNVKVESTFPSSTKTYAYDFDRNITGWTFHLDYQTVVVDQISYDRNSGEPNFATSAVIGSFPSGVVSTSSYIQVMNEVTGIVNVTHPPAVYAGSIYPDARSNVPLLVMSLTWTDNQTPPQKTTHRIAKILSWEPGVPVGTPTTSTGYTAVVTA